MAGYDANKSRKNIVILGGSYGGVSTAHYLLKHAVPQLYDDTIQVIVVSPSTTVMCRPACPRAMISDSMFPQDKLFVSIPKIFKQYPKGRFGFVEGAATQLDHRDRTVTITLANTTKETINFYALVIATGSSTTSPLLGLNKTDDFLRSKWNEFRQALPDARSIVIAGGGPAGVETAGELGEHLNGRAAWLSSTLTNPRVSITLVNAGPRILPALRPSLAKKAEDFLAKVGVTVINDMRVKNVTPSGAGTENVASKATLELKDGSLLDADLYIPATGTTWNTGFIHQDLLTPDKRVRVDPSTLRVEDAGPRIYAVGDVASYSRPAIHLILEAIPVICANIKRDLLKDSGIEESSLIGDRSFEEDKRETQLVPIGKTKGVGAAMGWQIPSFLVWLIKGRDYWLWTTGGLWSGKQWTKEK